jgi:ribokinase
MRDLLDRHSPVPGVTASFVIEMGFSVIVGSCIVDFCVRVPSLPQRGETILASSVSRSLGGKGANQATALRRLGGEVAIVTCVGDDDFGAAFLHLFAEEGIDAGFVHRDRSVPTGIAFPMILPGGANAIVAPIQISSRSPASPKIFI